MKDESVKIGAAVHVHSDGTWSEITVKVLWPDKKLGVNPFVTVGTEQESVVVNGRNQWDQVKAMVEEALTQIEEDGDEG